MKTVTLNGTTWDTEDIDYDGRTHFMHAEAMLIAEQVGKRLPTYDEFFALYKLVREWDTDKCGIWFAEKAEDLRTDKSLFLPANGNIACGGTTVLHIDRVGSYWSSTVINMHLAYRLYFNATDHIGPLDSHRKNSFGVRCIAK